MATVEFGGQALQLLPDKAVLLPASATLLVADAHIGKAASFRRLGVPVPETTTLATLDRLSALVDAHVVRRIVFLGDLLHSAHAHAAPTLAAFARWRAAYAGLELLLVRGNHDDRAGDPPASLDVQAVDEPLRLDGLALCHHPDPRPDRAVLAGHVHPCVQVGGRGRDRLRLPCFWFGAEVGVLPAFGSFTGMHTIHAAPGDRVFVTDGERVRPLPVLHTLAP